MKRISVTIATVLSFLFNPCHSQNLGECGTNSNIQNSIIPLSSSGCQNTGNDWITKYRTPQYWIPNSSTPIKTILINYIICQDGNGDNAWQDSQAFRDQVDQMFVEINNRYSNSQPKGYPLTCEPTMSHIADTRIRFELNEIIFIPNSTFNNSCSFSAGQTIDDYVWANYPSSRVAMNHIFTEPDANVSSACNYWGFYWINNGRSFVLTKGSMFSNWFVVWPDHVNHICHEYGHALGLHHTYNSEVTQISNFDFLDDVFGLCSEPEMSNNTPPCNATCIPPAGNVCYLQSCFFDGVIGSPIMCGGVDPTYISPKSAGRMHRALSLFDNLFLLPNQPMHQYVKEKYSYAIPLEITSNETWDFAIQLYQDIVVKSGNVLTISCEVRMPINGKIIVERGAKLVIDAGKITCAWDKNFWRGIEVWGNPTQPQGNVTANGQGQVYIINGGTIENAEIGIAAMQYGANGLPVPNFYGGIIRAENASFKNNITGVQIWNYPSPPLTIFAANFSWFKNCTFETDASWPDNSIYPQYCVDLRELTGFVTMLGCTFRNSAPGNFPVGNRGTGIFGVESMFRVGAYCPTPLCNNPITNTFENLTYGVNGAASVGILTCNVDRATFTNCDKGVSLRGIDWASTTRCEFTVPSGTQNDPHFGIYYDDCDGFSLQENKIYGVGSPNYNVGIIIKDSRDRSNIVYNNTLDNLHVGLEALGDNDGPSDEDGLRFNCNDMTNNLYDIFVTNATNQNSITTDIGMIQGQLDLSAPSPKQLVRNTYSAICVGTNENQYRVTKNSINPIIHEHHVDAFTLPQCRDGLVITTQRNYTFNKTQDCPSFLSTPTNHSTLRAQLITYGNEIAQQQALLNAGSSSSLLNTIATGSPGTVKNELLAVGPYLSDDVLISAITSGLPPGTLKEILIPNSPLSTPVMAVLNQQHLPNGTYEELQAVQTGTSEREKVEIHIQQLKFERDLILSERIRSLLNDSNVVSPFDSVTAIIKYEQIPDQKCKLASGYIAKGDYVRADSTLDVIAAEQQPAMDNFCRLLRILVELRQSLQGCLALYSDSLTTNEVIAIAAEQNEKGCAQAEALLMKVFMYFYQEDVVFPENEISLREIQGTDGSNANPDFKAYPNPANDWLNVEYKISSITSTAQLIIIDITGKEVLRQNISPAEKNTRVDISMLCSGLYFWRVESDAEILFTDKFSVLK